MPLKINKKHILLVEGEDEINFFDSYLKHLSIENIQVIAVGGKSNFKNKIPELIRIPHFDEIEKIGLIRDADTDFDAALASIYDRLSDNDFSPIKQHNEFSKSNPSVGIFIMPGKNRDGELEDLCLEAIDEHDKNLKCTNEFVECIKRYEPHLNKISKRKVQTFLSSQKKLCNSLGLGAQKEYWNFESAVYDDLKSFIEKLAK